MRLLIAIVLVLLMPTFAGCFAATEAPTGDRDATTDLQNLEMQGGTLVRANTTSALFTWESTIGPGASSAIGSARNQGLPERASTTFDLPEGWLVRAAATLSWEGDDTDLTLAVRDGMAQRRCVDPTGADEPTRRACVAMVWSPDNLHGMIEVDVNENARQDVPFLVTLELDLVRPTSKTPSTLAPRPCEHPWPCADGTEWPVGLEGPFGILEAEKEIRVPSHDGVLLHGWSWRPDLPEGVGAPTVLVISPYLGNEGGQDMVTNLYGRQALAQFVPRGFAFMLMEIRGTGASGGCFGHHDMDAQLDPAAIVDWIAAQPWSNGRVGMTGLSYMGVASLQGAMHAGEALKTVVPSGVPHAYLYHHTPQGAFSTSAGAYEATQHTTGTPPAALRTGPDATLTSAQVAPERYCDEYRRNMLVEATGQVSDDRDPDFWTERDAYARYGDITASVFITEGFNDPYIRWGQEVAWELMTDAPKRIVFGQWPHIDGGTPWWYHERLDWFDYWLKGVGHPPGLGLVEYQDDSRDWRTSAAWPPAEAAQEVLYLAGGKATPDPAEGDASYRSTPLLPGASVEDLACDRTGPSAQGIVLKTAVLDTPAVIAGNPFAMLTLTSDQPGGLVGLYVFRVGGGECDPTLLTWGAADLRFHAGGYTGTDFPIGKPTPVRIDLEPIASRVGTGERLVLVVAHPGPYQTKDTDSPDRLLPDGPSTDGRIGQAYHPTLSLHGGSSGDASQIVLPIVDGTLGGGPPVLEYPPRPLMPER